MADPSNSSPHRSMEDTEIEASDTPHPILNLIDDIWSLILKYLTVRDLCRLRLVCRAWNEKLFPMNSVCFVKLEDIHRNSHRNITDGIISVLQKVKNVQR